MKFIKIPLLTAEGAYRPATHAPSTRRAAPLMSPLEDPHSEAISPATLPSFLNRRDGWRLLGNASEASSNVVPSRRISCRRRQSMAGVSTAPGHIALHVMSVRATSTDLVVM